eukprot:Awhi_evm1s6272
MSDHFANIVTIQVEDIVYEESEEFMRTISPVFDKMLEPNTFKEGEDHIISLINKTKAEYELFRRFLHFPDVDSESYAVESKELTKEEVFLVVPWLSEYQIHNSFFNRCENILTSDYRSRFDVDTEFAIKYGFYNFYQVLLNRLFSADVEIKCRYNCKAENIKSMTTDEEESDNWKTQ